MARQSLTWVGGSADTLPAAAAKIDANTAELYTLVGAAQSAADAAASAAAAKASLASPAFTGTPTAPTAGGGTSTTQIANTAFVQSALAALAASSSLATVASAAALATTPGTAGQFVIVGGIRGGLFQHAASGTVDNVLTFAAQTAGVWVRQWDGVELNMAWAGVVPQATYGASVTFGDQSAAINAAINALRDVAGGGTVRHPGGWVHATQPVALYYDALAGAGRRGGVILKGVSAISYGQVNVPASRLVYSGTGRRFVDARSSTSRIEDLAILYDAPSRTVNDLRTTSGSAIVTSATAAFVSGDVGTRISAEGLPMLATIQSVQSGTQATISGPATITQGRTLTDAALTASSVTMTSASGAFTDADLYMRVEGITSAETGANGGNHIAEVVNSTTAKLRYASTATASGVTVKVGEVGAAIGGFQGALLDFTWYPQGGVEGADSSGDSNGPRVQGCLLGTYALSGPRPTSADCLIDFGNTVVASAHDTKFIGARFGVRGMGSIPTTGSTANTYFANSVLVQGCDFAYCWGGAVANPAQAWHIVSNCIEGYTAETAYDTPGDTGTDHLVISDGAYAQVIGVLIANNWCGDTGGANRAEVWIDTGPAQWMGCSIAGNDFGPIDASLAIRLRSGVNGMLIQGNAIQCQRGVDFGSTSTGRKEGVVFSGNDLSNCATPLVGTPQYGCIIGPNFDASGGQGTNPGQKKWGGIGTLTAAPQHPGGVPLIGVAQYGVTKWQIGEDAIPQWSDATVTSTSATAGAATLPANPVGFLLVKDPGGTTRKVPYYAT